MVRGSVSLAKKLGISELLIGLTVVGFGTSAPELLVSLQAAWQGSSEIALGNVVGSNTANILLILGIGACIAPLISQGAAVRRDTLLMVAVSVLLLVVCWLGVITCSVGMVMCAMLVAYVVYAYMSEQRQLAIDKKNNSEYTHASDVEEHAGDKPLSSTVAIITVIVGLAMLVLGANVLVKGAVSIAQGFGISEAVIGLSLVAVGTSLPELATSIVASLKKHGDVVLGNVIGSNIFNILLILGLTSAILPIPVDSRFATHDMPISLATSVLLAVLLLWRGSLGQGVGAIFLVLYAAYMAYLFMVPVI